MTIQLAATLLIAAILVCAAYQLGYENGYFEGKRAGRRSAISEIEKRLTAAKRSWPRYNHHG